MPAFLCSWVYVVILRPAEIAVIVLTCAEYSVQPLRSLIGLDQIGAAEEEKVTKLIALLGLGWCFFLAAYIYYIAKTPNIYRHYNVH